MKHTTDIYDTKGNLIRSEKLCTLLDYVKMERLKPGQELFIGGVKEEDGIECSFGTESIWIGLATPFHKPSENDGEIGWNYNNPRMNKFVLEVYCY